MPHVPQEPLTRLWVKTIAQIVSPWQPPPWALLTLDPQYPHQEGSMNLTGSDSWNYTSPAPVDDVDSTLGWYYPLTRTLAFDTSILLDWYADQIQIDIKIGSGASDYWIGHHFRKILAGCERGNPWYLPPTNVPPIIGAGGAVITAWRPVPGTLISQIPPPFTPNHTLNLWSGSFLAKGPINDRVITYKPTYPPGAIPGTTQPTGRGAILRQKSKARIYTDYGHVTRHAAFTNAANQWAALTDAERHAWTQAAKHCKPPLNGYTLWTQIITTKRLDRIPALAARANVALTPPTIDP